MAEPTEYAGKTIVIASGGFDPLHYGHIRYLRAARQLGDALFVAVNTDAWLVRKKGRAFMDENTRNSVVGGLRYVDCSIVNFNDDDNTACHAIRATIALCPDAARYIFANGGDRTAENIPEMNVTYARPVEFVFGVGGDTKQASSSDFLAKWREPLWVERPWGRWCVVDQGPRFKVKRLEILPDKAISMQYHNHRTEEWTVVQGSALASVNGKVATYNVGQRFTVPVGHLHRVYNAGFGPLVCIEVQHGERCEEEDIVRV